MPDTLLDAVKEEQNRAREAGRSARGAHVSGTGNRGKYAMSFYYIVSHDLHVRTGDATKRSAAHFSLLVWLSNRIQVAVRFAEVQYEVEEGEDEECDIGRVVLLLFYVLPESTRRW